MNRRGHLGTLLLVLGALILVSYALFVMVGFNGDLSKKKAELKGLYGRSDATHKALIKDVKEIFLKSIEVSKNKEGEDFEKAFNESLKSFAFQEREKIGSGLNNNLYAKLSTGDYSLIFGGSNYELIVSGVFENYVSEKNEMRYQYSIRVLFDKSKVISVEEF